MFDATENAIASVCQNPMNYINKARWNPETAQFAISSLFLVAQVSTFFIAPPSAGTVVELLQEHELLTPFTKQFAYWFTALFNSFGISMALLLLKEKVNNKLFCNTEQRQLLNCNGKLFRALGNSKDAAEQGKSYGLKLDIADLTSTALAV